LTEYLFSYGTLQKDKVQLDLFGRLLNGAKDMLIGYRVSSIEIADPVFLATGAGSHQRIAIVTNEITDFIEGTAFEVNPEELLHADQYEPADYSRIKVKLESGKEAWVYAAK
jgi:Gamma-glutamyl cyclotransferase, AIG2-like